MPSIPKQECVANNFRLLFQPIMPEGPSRHEFIAVAAEWVAHQWQVEPTALLSLPDVGQLMDKEALGVKRLF